ncbi:hypothetical protein GQ457_05G030640 [Hibiscus cannabinus]
MLTIDHWNEKYLVSEPVILAMDEVHHANWPVTQDVMHQVFSTYGSVAEIVPVKSSFSIQFLITYQGYGAMAAMSSLQGRNIYDGCCQLEIQLHNDAGLLNCVEPKQVSTTEILTEEECSDNLLEPPSTQGIVSTELVEKEYEPLLTVSNEVEVFDKLSVIADVESDGFDDSVSGLLKVPLDQGCDILNRGLLKPSSIQGIWSDSLMAMRGMNFSETGALEERLQINDALLTMRESVHLVIDCPFDRVSQSFRHCARTRYLEGRVNDRGRFAINVETEQVVEVKDPYRFRLLLMGNQNYLGETVILRNSINIIMQFRKYCLQQFEMSVRTEKEVASQRILVTEVNGCMIKQPLLVLVVDEKFYKNGRESKMLDHVSYGIQAVAALKEIIETMGMSSVGIQVDKLNIFMKNGVWNNIIMDQSILKSLARKHLLTVVNGDGCFVEPPPKSLQNLILKSVKNVVMNQFVSDNMKIEQATRNYAADLKTSVCNTWTPKELLVLEAFFTKAEKCCVSTVLGYLAELMNDTKEVDMTKNMVVFSVERELINFTEPLFEDIVVVFVAGQLDKKRIVASRKLKVHGGHNFRMYVRQLQVVVSRGIIRGGLVVVQHKLSSPPLMFSDALTKDKAISNAENGVRSLFAPEVFESLGTIALDSQLLEPDGLCPNHNPNLEVQSSKAFGPGRETILSEAANMIGHGFNFDMNHKLTTLLLVLDPNLVKRKVACKQRFLEERLKRVDLLTLVKSVINENVDSDHLERKRGNVWSNHLKKVRIFAYVFKGDHGSFWTETKRALVNVWSNHLKKSQVIAFVFNGGYGFFLLILEDKDSFIKLMARRLNPETSQFFDEVEKRYGIHVIEYMFADARRNGRILCRISREAGGFRVNVVKFRADGEEGEYAKTELQLGSFPAILFFPKHYSSEKRDVGSLTAFVYALR